MDTLRKNVKENAESMKQSQATIEKMAKEKQTQEKNHSEVIRELFTHGKAMVQICSCRPT